MGAYLSEPITKKESSNEVGKNVAFGASSMQGWRNSQEDAHNCCLDFDEDVSLFAVYDGHGGHEVATYCARNLPNFIKQTDAYKRGDIKQALIDAFLEFDATLTKPEVVSILKELAESSTSERKEDDATESDEEENVNNLCMEATMPLEQVMAKYQAEVSNAHMKNLKNEMGGKHMSSGAGCSSSSSSAWNTNEADVSSSSQPCVSALSSGKERKESESTGSNEVEQILDSTTSNGNAHTSPPVGSTADVEPTKSADMPDSSEDVKEKVASPTKGVCEESSVNEVETNGKELNRIGDADSSKGGGDNVSSSSCTTIENGDAGQQERISSSGRRRVQTIDLYKRLLKKDEDNSEEDDDENDKTFDGVRVSFRDDEDSEDADEDESEEDEEDADENESEGDDKDEDDCDADEDADDENDDENDDIEEPGSDSGCTALVAILKGNELYVANAGDSRCVLCRDGFAVELTVDHKPEESSELSRIIRAGGEVTMDGRVNGGLNLSRALGDHAYKQNTSLPPQEQMISPLPDVTRITIEPERDEFLILACDGIWNFYSSEEVVDFIQPRLDDDYNNISDVCEELFDRCLAPDTFGNGAGCDNMTAIIIRFKPPSKETSSKATTDAVCKVTKKRSVSPPATANNGNNDCTTEEKAINSCKRPKTEAAI